MCVCVCVQEGRFKERLQCRVGDNEQDPLLRDTSHSDSSKVCEHVMLLTNSDLHLAPAAGHPMNTEQQELTNEMLHD